MVLPQDSSTRPGRPTCLVWLPLEDESCSCSCCDRMTFALSTVSSASSVATQRRRAAWQLAASGAAAESGVVNNRGAGGSGSRSVARQCESAGGVLTRRMSHSNLGGTMKTTQYPSTGRASRPTRPRFARAARAASRSCTPRACTPRAPARCTHPRGRRARQPRPTPGAPLAGRLREWLCANVKPFPPARLTGCCFFFNTLTNMSETHVTWGLVCTPHRPRRGCTAGRAAESHV